MNKTSAIGVIFGALLLATGFGAGAKDRFILLQSTTSTQNSGLYDHLLPHFTKETGIEVRVVAVGTGQAIKNAHNCDGDVLLVHARNAEEAFVDAGYGVARHDVMYNDFVIVGPAGDPAGIATAADTVAALQAIAGKKAAFASRGDDSGTHKKETALWADAGIDAIAASGDWYRETGSGMGATLNIAVGMSAYTLTDRATWMAFANKQQHGILFQGDAGLYNQYGVIAVDPDHCPRARHADALAFVDWLLSAQGQGAIAGFAVEGQQLFFPNAGHNPS